MGCGCSLIGKGVVWIAPYGKRLELKELSNTSVFQVNREGQQVRVPDDDSLAGGNCASIERINRVTLQVDTRSFCPETLAWAVGGDATNQPGAARTAEKHIANPGCLVPLNFVPDWTQAHAVKPNTGADWVEDTDYVLRPSGVFIPATSNIPAAAEINVDYTSFESDIVEAFLYSSRNYRMFLEGENLADEGGLLKIDCHKVSTGGAGSVGYKGNDSASMSVTGEVLSDATKTGTGVSKYYYAQKLKQGLMAAA